MRVVFAVPPDIDTFEIPVTTGIVLGGQCCRSATTQKAYPVGTVVVFLELEPLPPGAEEHWLLHRLVPPLQEVPHDWMTVENE